LSPASLDLVYEVTDAQGTQYRWGPNEPAGRRLRNFGFRTKIGEGFSDASGQLARRIDLDYPDLELVNSFVATGADGSVAYEGRLSEMPRELAESHSIGVSFAGWMAHAKDRKFSEIYVDRDLGAWSGIPRTRRSVLLANNFNPTDGSVASDAANTAAVETTFTGAWVSPFMPLSEAWYDAGPGLTIGKVAYTVTRAGAETGAGAAPWFIGVVVAADQTPSVLSQSANHAGAANPSSFVFTPTINTGRWAYFENYYQSTPSGADGNAYTLYWTNVGVYGRHNVTLYTGEPGQPGGVLASETIKDIVGRWCPHLNTDGVQTTSYVIQHLTFKDRTYPYDAFLEINKYHQWHLGVWENQTLHFKPYDFSDYDWEIRTDDPGTTFSPQGPSTDNLFNGITVTYTDVLTGTVGRLTPDTNTELADTNPENPWNKHGIDHWDEIELSAPTMAAQALQIGRIALSDRNRPKAPGTITVKGYVRDRAGVDQPVWKVRAGDMIAVTNFPNDQPRLIVETDYNDETKEVSLSIDRPFALLDAYLDRLGTAMKAKGLS